MKRISHPIPLRCILVVPFVLQTVGAVALVGYLSYQSGQEATTKLANQLMEETGDLVAHQINDNLEIAQLAARTNASAVRAGYINGLDPKTVEPYYIEQLRLTPTLTALGLNNKNREFLGIERPQPNFLIIRRFQPTGANQGFYRYRADQNGKNLVLQDIRHNFDPHNDPPGNPWYEAARRSLNGTWRLAVSLGLGQDSPVLHLIYALPFNNAAGQFEGVLTANVSLTHLGDFLKNLNISESGQVFLMEPDGMIVAASTGEVSFDRTRNPNHAQNVAVKPRRRSALQSQDPLTRAAASYLLTPKGQAQESNSSIRHLQSSSFWFNQQRYFLHVVPLEGDLNWLTVIVVPEAKFMSSIWANNQRTLILCVLTLLGSIALGYLTAKRIVEPIARLNKASLALTEGVWQEQLSENISIAEVKSLTHSFNQTAVQLYQSFDRIKTALAESEEKFTSIFRTNPDPIGIISFEDERILDVNEGMVEFFGYSREAMIGRLPTELSLWGEQSERQQLRQQLRQHNRLRNVEVTACTKSGDRKTILLSADLKELDGQLCVIVAIKDISDRKQIEIALEKSEARLRKLTEASPAVVYTVIEDPIKGIARFEYLSPAAEAIHELPIEELRQNGALISAQIHPDDREAYWRAVMASLKTMQSFSHEWRIITPSGNIKWLQANSRPERSKNGEIIWHGIVIEVSDRKRAEIALRQYERIVASTTDGIALIDTQFCYQVTNQTYLTWHNKTNAEIIGVPVSRIVGEEVFAREILPRYVRCLAGETIEHSGWFEVSALGRQFLSVTYAPYVDKNGNISGIVVSLRNLTSLKQAEQELEKAAEITRKSEARFQQLAAAVPGMIYTYTQTAEGSYQFDYVSTMSRTILELEPETIVADVNTALAQIHPDDRAAHASAVAHSAVTLEPFICSFRNITPSGQIKWLEASSRPLKQSDVSITWYGILLDISERYKINRMKDEFISIVTHELRTPLTSIRGALKLLASGMLDDEPETAQHMLKVADQSSDLLVRLVNDILSLERLESGKIELVKQPYKVQDLINQAVSAINVIAIEANVTFSITSLDAEVQVVPDAIVQTLINLLSNAIKFSPSESTVWIKAERREGGEINTSLPIHSSILISVKDQGRGVPGDKLESIFGRFQQVDSSDSREKGGTGLGLAICKNIVEQHGGQIWVESELSKGSTFYFTLPISSV